MSRRPPSANTGARSAKVVQRPRRRRHAAAPASLAVVASAFASARWRSSRASRYASGVDTTTLLALRFSIAAVVMLALSPRARGALAARPRAGDARRAGRDRLRRAGVHVLHRADARPGGARRAAPLPASGAGRAARGAAAARAAVGAEARRARRRAGRHGADGAAGAGRRRARRASGHPARRRVRRRRGGDLRRLHRRRRPRRAPGRAAADGHGGHRQRRGRVRRRGAGDRPALAGHAGGWLAVAGIALVSTVAAITLFFAGLERIGPTQASTLSTVEPLFTVRWPRSCSARRSRRCSSPAAR